MVEEKVPVDSKMVSVSLTTKMQVEVAYFETKLSDEPPTELHVHTKENVTVILFSER